MDQSVHRPTTRQGSRRPAHPPRTHHRHRHRVLALPPRPAAAHYQERSLTPTEDRAAGIAAPPPPYGLRLHDDARAPHQATSTPTTTDARWSHFKPSRRGQRKPSRRRALGLVDRERSARGKWSVTHPAAVAAVYASAAKVAA